MEIALDEDGESIPPDRCWSLMDRVRVGRIAALDGDQPLVAVVPFAIEHGDVVVGAKAGRGLPFLFGRQVAFEVDEFDADTEAGWSVVVRGIAYDITDTVDRRSERLRGVDVSCWCMDCIDGRIAIRPRDVRGRWLRSQRPAAGPAAVASAVR
jgi:hypothetical protein